MNKRQDSLISLANSENELSSAETESEEPIIMRWVSSGNHMLTRALSRKAKDSQNGDKNKLSYTERQSACNPEFVHNGKKNRLSYTAQPPCDSKIAKLKERLQEKEKLLYQLEKQEKDFLGKDNHSEDTKILRIEFEATTCKDYYLVPGCPETLIPGGKTVAIFGQLWNKRWRCVVENDDHLNNNGKNDTERSADQSQANDKQFANCYPLIGSIPSSIITELNEDTKMDTAHGEDTYSVECSEDKNSSLCECGRRLPSRRNSHSKHRSCSLCQYCTSPLPSPIKTITPEHLEELKFQRFPTVSSVPLPILPESPTETTIAELNMALESLAKITPRSPPVSAGSDSSRNSWSGRF